MRNFEEISVRDSRSCFLTYETEFILFLAVLEYSVFSMGCDISHVTLKVTSEIYLSISDVTYAPLRKTSNDVRRGTYVT